MTRTLMTLVAVACLAGGCANSQSVSEGAAGGLREILLGRAGARETGQPGTAEAGTVHQRQVLASLEANRADGGQGKVDGVPGSVLLSAPEDVASADEKAAAESADVAETAATEATEGMWWQKPLADRSFGEVVKDDVKLFPRELWKATKDSATLGNFIILSAAGGLSAISRGSWDHRVDHSLQYNHDHNSLFDKSGDFGSVAGSPLLHFGAALSTYGLSIPLKDDKLYGFSKSAVHALTLNGLVTVAMKVPVNDYSPNGERYAWPSGHTSSTATMAGVVWEHYGWQAGVPMYLLTGWVGASRLADREHWLSDVIFGAALGAVIGHSTARGRMVEVGGFTVLPYADPRGGAGVMLMREF